MNRKTNDESRPDKPTSRRSSRRQFLTRSSMALTGAALASQFPLAARAYRSEGSANDALGVALIGHGARGSGLLRRLLEQRTSLNLRFPMVCDVWKSRVEEAAELIKSETGSRPQTTSRYAEVLQSPEVDCIVVATPDFSHTPILVDAAHAGKHAYIEKPVSITLDQANQALEAVQENDIVFQAGTQFRESPAFRGAARAMQEGIIGRLVKVDCWYNRKEINWKRSYKNVRKNEVDWEQFLMDLPQRSFDPVRFRRWQLYRDYTNGLLGLLGAHLFDLSAWLSGDPLPDSVVGTEHHLLYPEHEHADFQECLFSYPKGFLMNFSSRHGNSAPATALNFYGTKGTLSCPFNMRADIVASGEGGSAPDSIDEPVSVEHIEGVNMFENWISCIRSGNVNTYADIHAAYAHSVMGALGIEAITSGRRIRFNQEERQIVGGG